MCKELRPSSLPGQGETPCRVVIYPPVGLTLSPILSFLSQKRRATALQRERDVHFHFHFQTQQQQSILCGSVCLLLCCCCCQEPVTGAKSIFSAIFFYITSRWLCITFPLLLLLLCPCILSAAAALSNSVLCNEEKAQQGTLTALPFL